MGSILCVYTRSNPMRTLDAIRAQLQAEVPTLRERYNVERLSICGSYGRGEQTKDSDLDLLVTFTETPGLIAFVGLEHYLEGALGLSVDLGTLEGLREGPRISGPRCVTIAPPPPSSARRRPERSLHLSLAPCVRPPGRSPFPCLLQHHATDRRGKSCSTRN